MKKRLFMVAGVIGLLGLVGVFAWLTAQPRPPAATGTIPLPDGSWVHLEAVTYGTNHLVGPRLAQLARRMPPTVQLLGLRVFGKRAAIRFATTTPSPQLVLWLNRGTYAARFPASLGDMSCVITDTNGFAAGEAIDYNIPYSLEAKPFNLFPRRAPEFLLKIYHHDSQGKVSLCGEMRIANPLYRSYPQWRPETLPATKPAGEVEATLHRVIANTSRNSGARTSKDGRLSVEVSPAGLDEMPNTLCHLSLRSLVSSNVTWGVAGVEVSDATGNRIRSGNFSWSGEGSDLTVSFSPGLWTNESAWKLAFELKRTAGFPPGEQFTFHNVPLGQLDQASRVGWSTNFNGVAVTLASLLRKPPVSGSSFSGTNLTRVEFEMSGLTNTLHLDMIAAVANNGTNLHRVSWGGSATSRSYEFKNVPLEADSVDFTFVVQTSRTVEFLVKPEAAVAPLTWTVESEPSQRIQR